MDTDDKVIEELVWHDLETDLPTGDANVVLFPFISDVGILYTTEHMYTASNPEYARQNALKNGYTSWFPIPKHPDEEKVLEKIKKMYKAEHSSEQQYYKGFKQATERIVEVLKELLPDRPNVVRAIEERFTKAVSSAEPTDDEY